jgi:transcriptional regulator with XRE-family HTH domain
MREHTQQDENKILLAVRKKLGLTQQQVADKARITIRHYQMFESGERKLSTSSFLTAGKVLEALELDLTAFARGQYAGLATDDTTLGGKNEHA